ncbi:MAG: Spy/CpxP family protein refolding chaperone [Syntrophales bacterium]
MKKTIIIGLCLTLALVLIGTAALAWGPGFGRGFGAGPGAGYPAIPNLTAEQSTQIKALQEAFLKENEPLQKEMAAKWAELRNLRFAPNSDAATDLAKQEEFSDLRTQFQEKLSNLRTEVQKVLTPEQLAQLPAAGPGRGFGPAAGFGPPMMGPRGRW